MVINRLGRGASRERGAFMVSGIKVNKMNLSSRGLVLLKIKARMDVILFGFTLLNFFLI